LDTPYVWFGIIGWGVVLLLPFVARRRPMVTTVVICYVVLLLPVLGLVQIGAQLVADRYSYLACLGFAVLGGAGAVKLSNAQRLFGNGACAVSLTATGTVLLTLCVLTRHQARLWESGFTLWSHAVQIHPNSATAQHNLGCALTDLGQVRDSIVHFQRALDLDPSAADTNLELGKAMFKQGNWLQAAAHLENALAMKPDDAEAWNYAGAANLNLQRLEKATLAFQIAIELQPTNGTYFYNLGRAQMTSGNATGAVVSWHRALELMPESPRVLETLAWHLATSPDDSLRNGPVAVGLAERACANTMYQDAGCMNALAAAYAESGRFKDAARLAQQAIGIARATQRTQLAGEIEARLKFYQSEQPFREDDTNQPWNPTNR
jgi:Flp pilus assembly protein TadD